MVELGLGARGAEDAVEELAEEDGLCALGGVRLQAGVSAAAGGFLDFDPPPGGLVLLDQLYLGPGAPLPPLGLPTLAPLGYEDAYSPCLACVELVDAVAVAVARAVEDDGGSAEGLHERRLVSGVNEC